MAAAVILAVATGILLLIVILAARSYETGQALLEKQGKLCLGTVLAYDSDGIGVVQFLPPGAMAPLVAHGLGYFDKPQFPPGSKVAVLYSPLCPTLNCVVSNRTSDALKETLEQGCNSKGL